jgi:peptide methionine sulfoxide reductase msrA/msrB
MKHGTLNACAALAFFAIVALVLAVGPSGASREGSQPMTQSTEKPSPRYSRSGYDVTPLPPERVEELAGRLDEESFRITQKSGTEAAFCGNLHDNKKDGLYTCVVCGLPLFSSDAKFTSGTGWPSFFRPVDPAHVGERSDRSHGMVRTEIFCNRCRAHLGHVFEDGPKPTGLRFCLNSAALTFHEEGEALPAESLPVASETAYFAGGCFWGVEHAFQSYPGVIEVASGYQNGRTDDPTYKEVCGDRTGHAESVRVLYDPERVSYEELVRFFFRIHDPTTLNRQGPDVGSQYRSGIFTTGDEQKAVAERVARELAGSGTFGEKEIVTVIEPAGPFWPAEEYHQDYVEKTGRACHIDIAGALRASGVE